MLSNTILCSGRFSGGSHGFIIGHVAPEAQEGGPIALVQNGDKIKIDAQTRSIDILGISDAEMSARREQWKAPPLEVSRGALYKFIKNVSSASQGCTTDE